MSKETETAALDAPTLEQLEAELHKVENRHNYGRAVRNTVFLLIVVVAAAALVAVMALPVMKITGNSMEPTFQSGDIVVTKKGTDVVPGDVIAFYYNNNVLVKRVIAQGGDWIDIDEEGNIYVNNELLDEPYVLEKAYGDCNIELPYQVPDGKVFVLGDNRSISIDSRNTAVGCISTELVIGKIFVRVWPFTSIGLIQ